MRAMAWIEASMPESNSMDDWLTSLGSLSSQWPMPMHEVIGD
jgi:hypothetical protein